MYLAKFFAGCSRGWVFAANHRLYFNTGPREESWLLTGLLGGTTGLYAELDSGGIAGISDLSQNLFQGDEHFV